MTMKFTPGPWSFGNGEIRVMGGNTDLLSRIEPIAIVKRMYEPEQQANARLIATSPMLLEACRGLLDMITDSRLHGPEVIFAADAIAAAEGGA